MIAKKTLRELIDDVLKSTPENRLVAQLEYQKAVQQMKADVGRLTADPNWRAMEKIEGAIKAMKEDPEIKVSEVCTDFLDLMGDLLSKAWPHHDINRIVQPMQLHFTKVISKNASIKRAEKLTNTKEMNRAFLVKQSDVRDTKKLATRLQMQFPSLTERAALDAVRDWKKDYAQPEKRKT